MEFSKNKLGVSPLDVIHVARTLNFVTPTDIQIEQVLTMVDSEAEQDTTATWDLIVENVLHQVDVVQLPKRKPTSVLDNPENFPPKTITLDDIKDLSVEITGNLVIEELIKDCTDTDDETEFEVQDVIREALCKKFNVEND